MRPKQIILIGLACLLSFTGMAQTENDAWFEQGNAAYNDGNYASAIELYNKVLSSDFVSSPLLFNLGNAYYKMKDYPHAILNYEKALKLDPRNDDARTNLEIANLAIADRIDPIPQPFYAKWRNGLKNSFASDTWAVLSVVLFALLLFSIFLFIVSRRTSIRKTGFFVGWIAFVLLTVSWVVSLQKRSDAMRLDDAIVITPTVTVKSSPDSSAILAFPPVSNFVKGIIYRLLSFPMPWFPGKSGI